MEVILQKIKNECKHRGVYINESEVGIYNIEGPYEGVASLYICEIENAVVFKNKHGEKHHVLSFRDFVNIAMLWSKKNKKWSSLKVAESPWYKVFKEFSDGNSFYRISDTYEGGNILHKFVENLPF